MQLTCFAHTGLVVTPRTWASIVTPTVQYVEWDENGVTTFREYYDLVADPYQLVNLLGDSNPSNDPDVTGLSAQLALDRVCIGLGCPQPVISVLDTQPPGAPGTPFAVSTVPGQVSLTWAAADDDVSSWIIYRAYRDGGILAFGSLVSSSTTTVSFTDTGSAPGTVHTYSVEAVDQAGNVGPRTPESDPVTVLVPPPPPPNIFATDFSPGLGGWTTVSGLTIDSAIGSVACHQHTHRQTTQRYLRTRPVHYLQRSVRERELQSRVDRNRPNRVPDPLARTW